jgi:Asp-tRNA(Asn)/Glu-tRNA(Gln) amidotransferase A subunit family amidase
MRNKCQPEFTWQCLTLPCGNGFPISLHFVARHFAEDLLSRAECAYQEATD